MTVSNPGQSRAVIPPSKGRDEDEPHTAWQHTAQGLLGRVLYALSERATVDSLGMSGTEQQG